MHRFGSNTELWVRYFLKTSLLTGKFVEPQNSIKSSTCFLALTGEVEEIKKGITEQKNQLSPTADSEGFEPPVPCGTLVFKTSAFDHSANYPVFFAIRNLFSDGKDTNFISLSKTFTKKREII